MKEGKEEAKETFKQDEKKAEAILEEGGKKLKETVK